MLPRDLILAEPECRFSGVLADLAARIFKLTMPRGGCASNVNSLTEQTERPTSVGLGAPVERNHVLCEESLIQIPSYK